jgi:hypothetical protein
MKQWILRLFKSGFLSLIRIPQGVLNPPVDTHLLLQGEELAALMGYLLPVVGEEILCSVKDNGHTAHIMLRTGELIAYIKPFPKGDTKNQTYIKVELFEGNEGLAIWFLWAFFGYKVFISKPVLGLQLQQIEKPHEL